MAMIAGSYSCCSLRRGGLNRRLDTELSLISQRNLLLCILILLSKISHRGWKIKVRRRRTDVVIFQLSRPSSWSSLHRHTNANVPDSVTSWVQSVFVFRRSLGHVSTHNSAGFHMAGKRKDFSCRNAFFFFFLVGKKFCPYFWAGSKPPQELLYWWRKCVLAGRVFPCKTLTFASFKRPWKFTVQGIKYTYPVCIHNYAQLHAYTRLSTGFCIHTPDKRNSIFRALQPSP